VIPPGLERLIEEKNALRYPSPGDSKGGWQKEWYHFCILADGLDLLVNLSVCGDLRPSAIPGSRVARVILLARERGWHGDIETVDQRAVHLVPGEVGMELGQNRMSFRDGAFALTAALQGQPLAVDLRLEPRTYPLGLSREVAVGRGSIGWFAIPRLAATGQVVIGDRVHRLKEAPAYHDHNWGRWLWGQDFAWEWGFVHAAAGAENWCVIFDRTLNHARTSVLESTLALWRDEKLVKVFSRHEVSVRPLGYRHPDSLFRVPRPLALGVPELGRDVPQRFELTASWGGDRIACLIDTAYEAQILVPNEADLETTIITEVIGQVRMEGEIRGHRIDTAGRGVFEFLTS
jgi:hypothetical protein